MGLYIIYVLLCLIPAKIAAGKGRHGSLFFIVSLILSPVVGLILAFLESDNQEKLNDINFKDYLDQHKNRK